ncbi:hypothetical protein Q4Q39_18240 [Flavivirga amylovorans]|uniref:Uncharacterized protein n=1 Tax=Flavivirga amylovorans TaxID=870486 RepID=A0ABT8X734_9FLAO|nr:hypothetical protein [Flavivirga amylovorans]MDO5989349.1 hypothetical protein [Flavivirga amylovorans]
MTTKKPSYKFAEVTCAKKECNETFSVIISSICEVIDKPAVDIEVNPSIHDKTARKNTFDDYLVIKCSCGHSQRVYLLLKEKHHNLLKKLDGFWHAKN